MADINVITCDFRKSGQSHGVVWQYDYGQKIKLIGDNIDETMTVQWHYSGVTDVDSRAIEKVGDEYFAVIPNAALEQSDNVVGYVFTFDASVGNTIYIININIRERVSTTEESSTDDTPIYQQFIIDLTTLQTDLTTLESTVENAEALRVSAESARVTAEQGRVSAESSRVTEEEDRVSVESDRVIQESARVTAESSRVTAEDNRSVWEEYNALTEYEIGNKVYYLGSSYIAHDTPPVGTVPTNATYWQIIAERGDNGEMAKSDYDPTNKQTDAFDSANHEYANTTSGLTATTTQAAIDEVDANVDALEEDVGTQTYTEQNYVTNGESSTDSIDALDVGLNGHVVLFNGIFYDNAGAHNSIYRGKYLGTSYTAGQKAAIDAGTFDDLYIGDYWTIGGVNYRIAGFNYYYNVGDTNLTQHHAIIVPDTVLYTAPMNSTNTTTGGYVNSEMKTTNLASATATIETAFGAANVLTHRQLLVNATSDGKSSGWAWTDTKVEIMNEIMVYGSSAWGESSSNNGYNIASSNGQLPLFSLRHDLGNIRSSYWLRDVVSASLFTLVSGLGYASSNSASGAYGVRPAFLIS